MKRQNIAYLAYWLGVVAGATFVYILSSAYTCPV